MGGLGVLPILGAILGTGMSVANSFAADEAQAIAARDATEQRVRALEASLPGEEVRQQQLVGLAKWAGLAAVVGAGVWVWRKRRPAPRRKTKRKRKRAR